jgi:hypothetical protein
VSVPEMEQGEPATDNDPVAPMTPPLLTVSEKLHVPVSASPSASEPEMVYGDPVFDSGPVVLMTPLESTVRPGGPDAAFRV